MLFMFRIGSMTRFLLLLIALISFPQIAETAYSPALPLIAKTYEVSSGRAAQTLSVYFMAFAVGVLFWGWICDRLGRRPAILAGVTVYLAACLAAVFCESFEALLGARILSAFGAAVGSIGVQTMLRDHYHADELVRVFSLMGVALALSPLLGLILGVWLSSSGVLATVFLGLLILAVLLLGFSIWGLPETRPDKKTEVSLIDVGVRLFRDHDIWRSAVLVSLFNTTIFAFYQWAPFLLRELGLDSQPMLMAGALLATGTLAGAFLSRHWLKQGCSPHTVMRRNTFILALAGLGLRLISTHLVFLLAPAMLIALAYALAIPNLLSIALRRYRHEAGMAGAVFGLMYSLLLGAGLALSAWWGDLANATLACAAAANLLLVHSSVEK